MLGAIGRTLWLEGTSWRAKRQNCQTHEAYQRAGELWSSLEAGNEVMESIGHPPSRLWPSVEMWLKSKGWGRGMILGGFGT